MFTSFNEFGNQRILEKGKFVYTIKSIMSNPSPTRKRTHIKPWYKAGCLGILLMLALVVILLYFYQTVYGAAPDKTAATSRGQQNPASTDSLIDRTAEGIPTYACDSLDIALALIPRTEQLIRHTGYTVSYNKDWRLPNWVGYELTRQETQGTEDRTDRFLADPLVAGSMATNSDYTRSGYDKGHMAPAADMKWDPEVMKESFYFSNICPQHPELNRRRWKDLEEKIRDWAIADSALIIVCGPIVAPSSKTLGKNQIAVPQKFFKVILSPYITTPKAIGFLFDNERSVDSLHTYIVTVDSIEKLTGLDFFAPLPDDIEDQVEATADRKQWGL